MASFTFYNDGKLNIMKAMNLDTDTLKVSLHASSYNPDKDAHSTYSDLNNELAGSGNYTVGGATVTNNAVTVDDTNDRAYLDMDDPTWATLAQSAGIRYAVLRSNTDSDNLIGWWDFVTDQEPDGTNFIIIIAAAASGGALYIT